MKRKLTDLTVARIKRPTSGRLELWDTILPAFGFRISASGARTWIVAARRPGAKHPVRLKVGTPDEPDRMSLADARAKARQLMEDRAPELPVTFKDLAGQFLEHGRTKRGRPLRPATKKEYKRALLTYAVPLHAEPVREIRRGEIAGLIREVANTRGSTSAMRTRAALSRFWAGRSRAIWSTPTWWSGLRATARRSASASSAMPSCARSGRQRKNDPISA